jgi:hypothetical protein
MEDGLATGWKEAEGQGEHLIWLAVIWRGNTPLVPSVRR